MEIKDQKVLQEEIDGIEDYLNAEVHSRCDYDIYSSLVDMINRLSRVVDILTEERDINDSKIMIHKNQSEIQFEGLCVEDEKVMEGLGG